MSRTAASQPGQISLPGMAVRTEAFPLDVVPRPPGVAADYKLFLALFPPPGDQQRIATIVQQLCSQQGVDERNVLKPDRLHITLHGLGDFSDHVPLAVVDAARAAAASVACPRRPILMDRAMVFRRSSHGSKDAFVLCCDAPSCASVARLRQSLALALRRVGLRPRASYTPHMTLAYGVQPCAPVSIEPIHWTATEFALVLSHVGLTHHQWIDRWHLGPQQR